MYSFIFTLLLKENSLKDGKINLIMKFITLINLFINLYIGLILKFKIFTLFNYNIFYNNICLGLSLIEFNNFP